MAIDIFLELTGVAGEAQDKTMKDKKAIDILAWSWGMSQSGTTHMGKGGGAGKVNVQDISLTKYVDASSATLMQFCCQGKHIDKGTLTLRKASGSDAPGLLHGDRVRGADRVGDLDRGQRRRRPVHRERDAELSAVQLQVQAPGEDRLGLGREDLEVGRRPERQRVTS